MFAEGFGVHIRMEHVHKTALLNTAKTLSDTRELCQVQIKMAQFVTENIA